MSRYTKRQIRDAVEDLEACASTWLWGPDGNPYSQVSEDAGLAEQVYLTLSGCGGVFRNIGLATHLDTIDNGDGTTITARMLEGAQLLREGWLPGDPLYWLTDASRG